MIKRIKILLSVLLIIPVIACEDEFLERTPTDAIAAADALANEENMQLVLNGIHRGLFSQSQTVFPGGNTARANNHFWVPMGDNLSGDLIHSANANNLGWRTTMQWNDHTIPTSLTNELLWYHRYNIILHANLLINEIENGGLTMTEGLSRILGQAYTYRAYAYLSLVQHYGRGYLIGSPSTDPGVPILFASEPPFESAPRSTVQEVYDQIESDLDAAIVAFTEGGDTGGSGSASASDKMQLNSNVAHGLKARWALSKGDWQTAADEAAVAREGYPLLGEDAWKSGFNSNELSEVMWGSHVIETETTFFRSYFYLASNTFNGSQIRNNPKIADRRLVKAIPDSDYRKDVFLPDAPNSNTSAANGEGGWANNTNPLYSTEEEFNAAIAEIKSAYGLVSGHNTHPYMHFKLKQANPGTIDPDDVIYMRSAEMYLIEAEAKLMMGDLDAAKEALAPLAQARDTEWNSGDFETENQFFEHLKFQWKLEMWGEGFGYTNHIRWDEGIDHAADGGSGASEVLYQDAYQIDRPSVNDDWIFKIPQAEIDANPNIGPSDQN